MGSLKPLVAPFPNPYSPCLVGSSYACQPPRPLWPGRRLLSNLCVPRPAHEPSRPNREARVCVARSTGTKRWSNKRECKWVVSPLIIIRKDGRNGMAVGTWAERHLARVEMSIRLPSDR